LTWSQKVAAVDEDGSEITQWDGVTFKENLATGKQVPDDTARRKVYRYLDAKRAKWPKADFIVGNPPFIGARYIRKALDDGYVEMLRAQYDTVPKTCDS
jgi:hypothetical protein